MQSRIFYLVVNTIMSECVHMAAAAKLLGLTGFGLLGSTESLAR